jgi:hypothetical protein
MIGKRKFMSERKLPNEQLETIIPNKGSCIASDKITVDGMSVGYMYRTEPDFETDSGWRFFSGTEDQEYADDPDNMMIYDINTIANYDASIIPLLDAAVGSQFEKNNDGNFEPVE